mgnify:CR=1 FL=1
MSNFFSSLLTDNSTSSLDLGKVVLIIGASLLFGILVSLLYQFINKEKTYVKSYLLTMVMLPAIISIVIMLIGDNVARAFSLAGAFTLVRYRSVPGDPEDLCYLFLSLAIGLACGLGYIGYGFVFFLMLALLLIVLKYINFGEGKNTHMTLKITVPEALNFNGIFDELLNKYTENWKLTRVKTVDFGSVFELVYTIDIKKSVNHKEFIDNLRTLNGNMNITLILSRNEDKLYMQ